MKKKVEQWFKDHKVELASVWMEDEPGMVGDTIVIQGTLTVFDIAELSAMGLHTIMGINGGLALSFTTKSLAEWEGDD